MVLWGLILYLTVLVRDNLSQFKIIALVDMDDQMTISNNWYLYLGLYLRLFFRNVNPVTF